MYNTDSCKRTIKAFKTNDGLVDNIRHPKNKPHTYIYILYIWSDQYSDDSALLHLNCLIVVDPKRLMLHLFYVANSISYTKRTCLNYNVYSKHSYRKGASTSNLGRWGELPPRGHKIKYTTVYTHDKTIKECTQCI
jgi:hypothetical protein